MNLSKNKVYTVGIIFTIASFVIALEPKPKQVVMDMCIFYFKIAMVFFGIGYGLKDEDKN